MAGIRSRIARPALVASGMAEKLFSGLEVPYGSSLWNFDGHRVGGRWRVAVRKAPAVLGSLVRGGEESMKTFFLLYRLLSRMAEEGFVPLTRINGGGL